MQIRQEKFSAIRQHFVVSHILYRVRHKTYTYTFIYKVAVEKFITNQRKFQLKLLLKDTLSAKNTSF